MQTFFKQILYFTHKSLIIKYVIQHDFLLTLPGGYRMIHFKYTRARKATFLPSKKDSMLPVYHTNDKTILHKRETFSSQMIKVNHLNEKDRS